MDLELDSSWQSQLADELALPYFAELKEFVAKERAEQRTIYPPEPLILEAFHQTPFEDVKVVIIGQDPYHGPGQANGLCFSVPCGMPIPPSLRNIYAELKNDLGVSSIKKEGCLSSWAKQGVLLLNATLTVRLGEPKSHYGRGWERFTDAVVARLIARSDPIVFVLWGKSAQEKLGHILQNQNTQHAVLVAAHPSPLSAYNGFFGCRHFSLTNELLKKWGKTPIDWQP